MLKCDDEVSKALRKLVPGIGKSKTIKFDDANSGRETEFTFKRINNKRVTMDGTTIFDVPNKRGLRYFLEFETKPRMTEVYLEYFAFMMVGPEDKDICWAECSEREPRNFNKEVDDSMLRDLGYSMETKKRVLETGLSHLSEWLERAEQSKSKGGR